MIDSPSDDYDATAEQQQVLFTVNGFDVVGFKAFETDEAVTFSFSIASEIPPTPDNIDLPKLFFNTNAFDVLEKKGWYDKQNDRMLVQTRMTRECELSLSGKFIVKFTIIRTQKN